MYSTDFVATATGVIIGIKAIMLRTSSASVAMLNPFFKYIFKSPIQEVFQHQISINYHKLNLYIKVFNEEIYHENLIISNEIRAHASESRNEEELKIRVETLDPGYQLIFTGYRT
jgi:hypothetical protein